MEIVSSKGIIVYRDGDLISVYPNPRDVDLGFGVCDGNWHAIQVLILGEEIYIKVDEPIFIVDGEG